MAATSVVTTDDLTTLAASGRFATVLYRLSRDRFTGLVYADRDDGGAVISFRDGAPVFIEDLGGGQSLGDALLEQELLSPQNYALVVEHALSGLTGSEDAAFAEKAVELGVLTQEQVDAELARRVRGQLIQALAWDSARIDLDDDPDSLSGPELSQPLAPLLYMAVRTFFDDERVRVLLGDHREIYTRLLRPRDEVASELGLDDDERALLEALDPPASVRSAVEHTGADMVEAMQLVAMLVLTESVEYAGRPWSAPVETSSRARERKQSSAMGRYVAHGALTEERLGPIARPEPARPAAPAARPQQPAYEPFEAPPEPPPAQRNARSAPQPQPTHGRPDSAAQRPDSASAREGAARAPAAPAASGAPAARPQPESRPATTPVQAHAAATAPQPAKRATSIRPRKPEERPRRLGAALKRLGRELDQRRAQTQQLEPSDSGPVAKTAATVEGTAAAPAEATAATDKAAVRELIRRKRALVSQQTRAVGEAPAAAKTKPADLFRSAQDSLREQNFGRAHEQLVKACEGEPDNELYKMYRLWAAFRAGILQEAEITTLKNLVRDKLADDVLKPFAYYAMGHIVLGEKKEEGAEKFFKKALELDKNNKDAERHLRLIDLRRKSAANDAATNKIFGIEIGKKS